MNSLDITKIDPSNKFLKFLTKRIADDKYRGVISSQQNRYKIEDVNIILTELNKYRLNKRKPLKIRTADIRKRPENTEEEFDYAEIVSNIYDKMGRTTQDSLRKNFFPDFERMGLVTRTKVRGSFKSVEITKLGIDFVEASPIDRMLIFSNYLNTLLGGSIDLIISILTNDQFKWITEYEVMFIISAIGAQNTTFNITESEAIELINSYRRLSNVQKEYLITTLNNKLRPIKDQVKNKDRDWHNWKNKNDQIFQLLKQSVFFEVNNDKLMLRGEIVVNGTSYELVQKRRSQQEKNNYFEHHNIKKEQYKGYELHHIVEFSEIRTAEQLKMIDNWQNMILIDGQTHNEITVERGKTNYYLYNYSDEFAQISDIMKENIKKLQYDKNLIINRKLNKTIKEYNSVLIELI